LSPVATLKKSRLPQKLYFAPKLGYAVGMKLISFLLIAAFSIPAFAQDVYYRPTEKCLADINDAMFKIGTSQREEENEISFEMFLERNGDRYVFMYYKLDATTKGLDVTGKGAIDLVIKHSTEAQGLTDIDDCEVSNAEILEESR
jgi:hypothetical protein